MRKKLEKIATDFVGFNSGEVEKMTDTELITEILEILTDRIEIVGEHSHTIA